MAEKPKGKVGRPKKALHQPMGVSGLNRNTQFVTEDLNRQLQYPRAGKIYKEMRDTDSVVGAVTQLTLTLAETSNWRVLPGSNSKQDLEIAKFVEECMHDMSHSWGDFIAEALSCGQYGFAYHEVIYKLRNGYDKVSHKSSKYNDNRIGWCSLPLRSQLSMSGWRWSNDGELEGMLQRDHNGKELFIPYDKALLFRTTTEANNPEGRSFYRSAYKSWKFKNRIEEIEGISCERNLAGLPTFTPPDGLDLWNSNDPEMVKLLNYVEDTLDCVRNDTINGLIIPPGWEFNLVSSGGGVNTDLSNIIARHDYNIASTMLSDIVRVGAGNSGSYALADVKRSILAKSVESLLKKITNELNSRAIPQLLKYNAYGEVENLPTISYSPIETPSVKDVGFFLRSSGVSVQTMPSILEAILEYVDIDIDKSDIDEFIKNQTKINEANVKSAENASEQQELKQPSGIDGDTTAPKADVAPENKPERSPGKTGDEKSDSGNTTPV